MLDLQRTAGNRAVTGMIARLTDARLTYTDEAKKEGEGLDSKALPWREGGWRSGEILSNLTQVDEMATETFSDEVRCGANAVLAVAVTRGPQAVTDLAAKAVSAIANAKQDAKATPQDRSGATASLQAAIKALAAGTATYGDLSRVAHGLKVALAADPRGQTTGHEVVAMAGMVGPTSASSTPIQDPMHVFQLAEDLGTGEALILLVDTDEPDPSATMRSVRQLNHFVTVGKRGAKREDAKSKVYSKQRDWMLWMYDPYPRVGNQLMDETDARFFFLLEDAKGKPKAAYLFAKVKKAAPGP